jgi:hypothetical protein
MFFLVGGVLVFTKQRQPERIREIGYSSYLSQAGIIRQADMAKIGGQETVS